MKQKHGQSFIFSLAIIFILIGQIQSNLAQEATATPDPILMQFAVIGDYGQAGADARAVAAMVLSWEVDFIITTGDNNYPDGRQETIDRNIGRYYSSYIFPYEGVFESDISENRFFPTLGNHDWTRGGVQPYTDYFTLPNNERYYDFVMGDVHFFALSSDLNEPDGARINSIQHDWFRHALTTSDARWKIVYFHHAPYTSSELHSSTRRMRWSFQAWGADIVLSGHSHQYERLEVNNFPYIVNGSGGQSVRAFGTPLPESIVRYNGNFGAQLVSVYEDEIIFDFYSIGDGGTLIDSFTLKKFNLMPPPLATTTPAP